MVLSPTRHGQERMVKFIVALVAVVVGLTACAQSPPGPPRPPAGVPGPPGPPGPAGITTFMTNGINANGHDITNVNVITVTNLTAGTLTVTTFISSNNIVFSNSIVTNLTVISNLTAGTITATQFGVSNAVIWIGPGPTHAGTGTFTGNGSYNNPFIGDFDLIWTNTMASNLTRMLLPGTYWTVGRTDPGDMFLDGDRLIGDGYSTTIIKRDHSYVVGQRTLIGGGANNVEVAGVTLDCGATNTEAFKYNGVVLVGTNNWVHDVRVLHATGNATNGQECFPILLTIAGLSGQTYANNNIDHCEVSEVMGDYVGAIGTIAGGSISHCKVVFPTLFGTTTNFHGYGGNDLSFNECNGGFMAWYADSFWSTNVHISHNKFLNCYIGININDSLTGVDGFDISDNTIELAPSCTNFSGAGGISVWGNLAFKNIDIHDNLIRTPTNIYSINIWDSANTNINIKIHHNTVSLGSIVYFKSPNYVFEGNTYDDGTLLTNQAPGVGIVSTNEIWIGPGPTHAGTGAFTGLGTQLNPYVGDYDMIWSNKVIHHTNIVVHLLPGIFWTYAYPFDNSIMVPPGAQILGSGIDVTILKNDRRPMGGFSCFFTFFTSGCTIADMTLDSNTTHTETNAYDGIQIGGSNNVVRNVKHINGFGYSDPSGHGTNDQEGFSMLLVGTGDVKASGNLIDHCISEATWYPRTNIYFGNRVESNNYVSGLGVDSGGTVRNSTVRYPHLTGSTNENVNFHAIGFGGFNNTLLNNVVIGGQFGTSADTYTYSNCTIAYNVFNDVVRGWDLGSVGGSYSDISFIGNKILLNTNATGGIGILADDGIKNLLVEGNTILGPSGVSAFSLSYPNTTIYVTNHPDGLATNSNIKVINNTFGTNMPIYIGLGFIQNGSNFSTGISIDLSSNVPPPPGIYSAINYPNCVFTGNTDITGKPVGNITGHANEFALSGGTFYPSNDVPVNVVTNGMTNGWFWIGVMTNTLQCVWMSNNVVNFKRLAP